MAPLLSADLGGEATKAKDIYTLLEDWLSPGEIAKIITKNFTVNDSNVNKYENLIKQIYFKL